MYYIKGKIEGVFKNYVLLEANSIGYKIYLSNSISLEEGKEYLLYIFQDIKVEGKNQLVSNLYGFLSSRETELFSLLLTIKGIGCKTALTILTNNWEKILSLANSDEKIKLSELRGFNIRSATLFIQAVKGTKFQKQAKENPSLLSANSVKEIWDENEIITSLTEIGYKWDAIKKTLDIVREQKAQFGDLNSIINECLRTISRVSYAQ
ncbi:Holliday junction ATP-dependent DNA helicase RuvA [Candidatus Mycoplasma haematolamae str. Purdue]|uniref:Holliday junction branch migration complex subunit RuvA n=1 Tax=Mycoplasma haematolamae (strain Purdue) TaxID=1212765 RepID=I7C743_MYCHA|nr:Holliday junction branch migration protein RuvA [Candidatus Mycoplasma haematolamae]AFO52382.1 Holliday junction ATP-dependent DNA helicase RuvA [Candidatus Mycoplasma haematolamae str. Purdue]